MTLWQRLFVRLLHLYFRFARGVTFGVRAVIIREDDSVLLLRHTYVAGWQFPGGGVEVGETAADALARETFEEAAITIGGRPQLHGIFFNRRISRRDHIAVFVIRDFTVAGMKTPDREIAEVAFFPLSDLPPGTTPGTRRRLEEIQAGSPPAADW
jgi:8-oxo-dGTP pyrophosphatase MutT (NUDIX family)